MEMNVIPVAVSDQWTGEGGDQVVHGIRDITTVKADEWPGQMPRD